MPTKPAVDIRLSQVPTSDAIHALLAELTSAELEHLATDVIREHRRRLQQAQTIFEAVERAEAADVKTDELASLTHDYRIAMLNLHAQHQLVGLVVQRLGYVPEVDGLRPVLN